MGNHCCQLGEGGRGKPSEWEGRGVCFLQNPQSSSLEETAGSLLWEPLPRPPSQWKRNHLEMRAFLSMNALQFPARQSVYWRWVCESSALPGKRWARLEMETANSQGVVFGKNHYWGLMLLVLIAAENQECHLQTVIHKHSVSLPSTLTS